MTQLAIIGTIIAQSGKREEVLEAVLRHRTRCLKEEAGAIAFEVLIPVEDETTLILYELYADEAALSAHLNGKSLLTLQGEVASKVVRLTGVRCTLKGSPEIAA
ncbi:quinol monooxygenase YgiN [Chelatococcus asaccharovorans]|uniref:Quinol monooxygenase YgiN n=1 Tax=Chelatococcus asaccharovorans TaxID=28210 RepID=A0A2V3U4T7_9HYPH|nr:antibiotic biosynthesis monooxygenase [Chelatococcus asaccharovorans]MBS7702990.1 antibiotic biosynthesis monooxygenase [Chelatococcus asaccharovorans]PXW57288.1 quinol monooxygenase YgiN [Chelatococcus asaccharovorans]